MVAFGENNQAWRRADPADHVKNGVGVTNERSNAGPKLGSNRPHQWHRSRRCSRLCLAGTERGGARCAGEKCAPVHVDASWAPDGRAASDENEIHMKKISII